MSEKPCAKCGQAPRRKSGSYCLDCHAAYMRDKGGYKKAYRDLTPKQKAKERARSTVRVYVGRGKLVPGPCMECGTTENIEAHHHLGYDKPLHVQWLCRKHHREMHEREGYDHDFLDEGRRQEAEKAFDRDANAAEARREARRKRNRFSPD